MLVCTSWLFLYADEIFRHSKVEFHSIIPHEFYCFCFLREALLIFKRECAFGTAESNFWKRFTVDRTRRKSKSSHCKIRLKFFEKRDMKYELRTKNNLLQTPNVKTNTIGVNSLISRGAHLWNTLPDDIKIVNSIAIFKRKIKRWNGDKCNCKI